MAAVLEQEYLARMRDTSAATGNAAADPELAHVVAILFQDFIERGRDHQHISTPCAASRRVRQISRLNQWVAYGERYSDSVLTMYQKKTPPALANGAKLVEAGKALGGRLRICVRVIIYLVLSPRQPRGRQLLSDLKCKCQGKGIGLVRR